MTLTTRKAAVPGPPGDREAAILQAAQQILQSRPVLVALLESPQMRDVTIGELMDVLSRFGSGNVEQSLSAPAPGGAFGSEMRERLSDRELEVVRLIVEGLSNKQISDRLALSDKTVKNHISHILAKLSLTARTQVAVRALRDGLA
ncbi:MAG TPA: response regulator transcription factor [Candidatus Tumulicola sp.]|nr:response regulator transcription factor [Candidatus Tumulicola sp.]